MNREQPAPRMPPRHSSDAGFALVSVIWVATLLAVVAYIFTTSVRSYIRTTASSVAEAEAEALADSGLNLAILDIVRSTEPDYSQRFTVNGGQHSCSMPSGDIVTIRVRDEAGKIDLNIAGEELLQALISGAGASKEQGAAQAAAIADFRDADDNRRVNGAEKQDYIDAGLSRGPKNAPFESIDELAQLPGFDAGKVRQLRRYLTIHSGQEGIDPNASEVELIDILTRGAVDGLAGEFSDFEDNNGLPPRFVTVSARRAYGIEAEAVTRRGGVYVREAVMSLVAGRPSGNRATNASRSASPGKATTYRLWNWRRGARFMATQPINDGELPAC